MDKIIRYIDPLQMTEFICDPDDEETVLAYERKTVKGEYFFYADWAAEDDGKAAEEQKAKDSGKNVVLEDDVKIYHLAFDTIGKLYNLNPATNLMVAIATLSTLQSTAPVDWRVFNSILYWVNGSQSIGAWDGQLAPGGIITYGVGAGGAGYAVGDTGTVTTGGAHTWLDLTCTSRQPSGAGSYT